MIYFTVQDSNGDWLIIEESDAHQGVKGQCIAKFYNRRVPTPKGISYLDDAEKRAYEYVQFLNNKIAT